MCTLTRLTFCLTMIFASVNSQNRYIERQLMCALDQAPCDPWGQQIKAALPEIIGRGCQACDGGQARNANRVARFVQSRYPKIWAALVEKYSNPNNFENGQKFN